MKTKSDKKIVLTDPKGRVKRKVVKPIEAVHKGEDPDRMHPFRVKMYIQEHELAPRLKTVVYYVRGPKKRPDLVLVMAEQLWQKWEKFDLGLVGEYPDTREYGHAEFVDEDDFTNAWREVRKYKLEARVAGDEKDPMAFTCIGRTDL